MNNFKEKLRIVPDFPVPGILFYDLLPAISERGTFNEVIEQLYELYKDYPVTKVVGIDARGLIFGAPLACKFNAGFIPARKANKLPGKTIIEIYSKEYGEDHLAIQEDLIKPEDNVLIVDDVIATGGTAVAAEKLVSNYTKNIRHLFLLELSELNGLSKLSHEYKTLISV
ncbi:MAG: adenine phosphoribosyltransferase [Bacteroidales bacterium]|jgi:adenine phosphoribosyltransferase|nr:adenine phosphoribosyltransferase [Bacteroidales bacterium]